jgi:hypothetical protein
VGIVSKMLESSTLIRDIYRALLNNGRTYASFESRHSALLHDLRGKKEILDPMSGYGGLMKFCSESNHNLSSYSIEFNPPAYYWQVLMNPQNNSLFREFCAEMLASYNKWPDVRIRLAVSDDWFPGESLKLLKELWLFSADIFHRQPENFSIQELVTAFLLPFSGRLSSSIKGNVAINVTKGGMCPYNGWKDDFKKYIYRLSSVLEENMKSCRNAFQNVLLADARDCDLKEKKFAAMLTSPPYPNTKDYTKMFAPENALIQLFEDWSFLPMTKKSRRSIGASDVSSENGHVQRTIDDISSESAINFLQYIKSYNKTKRAVSDNRTYYIPYFCNYFSDIEKAYENISQTLTNDFIGYIVVVNNTARKKVIPVAEFVCETWKRIGFSAEIDNQFSTELSHVGGLNPGVKGLSARHMEYTIKITR